MILRYFVYGILHNQQPICKVVELEFSDKDYDECAEVEENCSISR